MTLTNMTLTNMTLTNMTLTNNTLTNMTLTNVIKIEDLNNKSLDDIIGLYRSGYVLEDTQFQSSVQTLQLPSFSSSITVFLAGALAGLAIMLILRKKSKQK